MNKREVVCEMEVTLDMISGKWKPIILYYLATYGTKRSGEIKAFINNISYKSLTKQLRELEDDGLIKRDVFPEIPPKVEYSLTTKGNSLMPILEAMCDWGASNMGDQYILTSPLCNGEDECCDEEADN